MNILVYVSSFAHGSIPLVSGCISRIMCLQVYLKVDSESLPMMGLGRWIISKDACHANMATWVWILNTMDWAVSACNPTTGKYVRKVCSRSLLPNLSSQISELQVQWENLSKNKKSDWEKMPIVNLHTSTHMLCVPPHKSIHTNIQMTLTCSSHVNGGWGEWGGNVKEDMSCGYSYFPCWLPASVSPTGESITLIFHA